MSFGFARAKLLHLLASAATLASVATLASAATLGYDMCVYCACAMIAVSGQTGVSTRQYRVVLHAALRIFGGFPFIAIAHCTEPSAFRALATVLPASIYLSTVSRRSTRTYVYALARIHIEMHAYVHTYAHTYTRIDTHIYIHTHTDMHTYIHTCIHTHIHTYIHTYTYNVSTRDMFM